MAFFDNVMQELRLLGDSVHFLWPSLLVRPRYLIKPVPGYYPVGKLEATMTGLTKPLGVCLLVI